MDIKQGIAFYKLGKSINDLNKSIDKEMSKMVMNTYTIPQCINITLSLFHQYSDKVMPNMASREWSIQARLLIPSIITSKISLAECIAILLQKLSVMAEKFELQEEFAEILGAGNEYN